MSYPVTLPRCARLLEPSSRRIGLALVLALGPLGCVEASFLPNDGGSDGEASAPSADARSPAPRSDDGGVSDGGWVQTSPGEPDAWWKPLRAQYAVRMRYFGRERAVESVASLRHETIMLARMSIDARGQVTMEAQRCLDEGYIDGLIKDKFRWIAPERLPRELHTLVLRNGKVETVAEPRQIGYTTELPGECSSSTQAPRRAAQAWLGSAPCTCGKDPLPVLPDDCRVTDPDQDQRAGLTVQHDNTFIGDMGLENVRLQDSCQVVDGEVLPDGTIRGHYIENFDYLGLSCGVVCGHNDILVCPRALNPVYFAPLDDKTPEGAEWDCAAVLRASRAGAVFPSEMLSFPNGC